MIGFIIISDITYFFNILIIKTTALHSYILEPTEYGSSIVSLVFAGDDREYIIVGTAYVDNDQQEPNKGRVIIFSVIDEQLSLVSAIEVTGAVYCMSEFNGRIVCGINGRVWDSCQLLFLCYFYLYYLTYHHRHLFTNGPRQIIISHMALITLIQYQDI